jgi:ribonuclease BN (tRNA processing enzyme)
MKIIFLGTNGWYDTGTGNTICTLVDTKDNYIILDAGNGIHKADRYIKEDKPVRLFLSHFHLDHIIGLHILLKFKFKSLSIYGQPGTSKIVPEFIGDLFSVPLNKLPYKTEVIDLNEGWHNEPFRLRCSKLKHVSPCFGYRLEIENKVISYCADTGYCKEAIELSRGADLLISECAFASGQENPEWPHLNPELAAKIAKEAGAKKLALTHFDSLVYLNLRQRRASERIAKRTFKNSLAAYDGTEIKLGGS